MNNFDGDLNQLKISVIGRLHRADSGAEISVVVRECQKNLDKLRLNGQESDDFWENIKWEIKREDLKKSQSQKALEKLLEAALKDLKAAKDS